jgi:hypothetical protein
MSKFRPDPTDPVANAKGWTRRQRRAREIEQLRAENKRLKAFIADKIHDATRERMLMEIDYRGSHE